ncbi:hypothetical protein [Streptomyces sp. V2]|uniref:hypothetical protein n=1 Tax=Streptomyces sp. V2 TaxID=1424099 RepID=UPI001F0C2831|nr:hypothetical protein [Streptomyces sp. V2]
MRLNLTEFTARTHRVVRPRTPLRHTSLTAPDPIGFLYGDRDGLNLLAGLFAFAARSRRTIVHVPLRNGLPPIEMPGDRVDLLLVHHTYGLRASKWPELRRSLGQGTPLTAHTDEPRTDRHAEAWRARSGHADLRDTFRHGTHAGTFFLFGSRDLFAQTARELTHAAQQGPRQKEVTEGRSTLMTNLPALHQPSGGGHPLEVLVCFKKRPPRDRKPPPSARPPTPALKTPAPPASRPPRTAASP